MFQSGGKLPWGLAIGGGATSVLALVLGWWGLPHFLHSMIAGGKGLKPDSEIRGMWSAFPDPIDFKIYVWNVTNPEQVHTGAKPVMQEIGPYFYGEWKWKENMHDSNKDDTVTYQQRIWWKFFPDKSGGLTGDELVTIPHPLIVGLAIAVEREKPGMMGMINKALPKIHRDPPNVFVTARARDVLFDGIVVNCTVTDFSAKALCAAIKKEGEKEFQFLSDNVFKFSFFGGKNYSLDPGRMTVKRGIKEPKDLGRVVLWKGKPRMSVWRGDPCNNITGTDSTIFPAFLKKEDGITAYAPDLCMSLTAKFDRDAEYMGVPVWRFTADLGDQSTNPEQRCFCVTEDTCMKRGAMDLFPCAKSPVVVTLPHCLRCHDDYVSSVIGLMPDEAKHGIVMEFEPMTGTPMVGRKRLQFNMPVHAIPKLTLMAEMPDALVPLFWVEEGLSLEEKYVNVLKSTLFRALKMITIFKWTMLVLGLGMGGAGGFLVYRKKQQDLLVQPPPPSSKVTNVSSVSDSNGVNGVRY